MYDDSEFGKIIQPKKKRDTNDDIPLSKKAEKQKRKNINRSLAANKMLDEYETKQEQKKKAKVKESSQKPSISQEHKKKVAHLKSISPNHKDSTILEQLKKHDFDLNDAMQALMNIPEDEEESSLMEEFQTLSEPKKKKQTTHEDPEITAQELMNQLYDHMQNDTLEMNSQQFNELFEEIAYIIKEDQKLKGFGQFEINQFVDNCFSIKDTLLEGLQEIHIDEDDPLLKQTQQFLENIIKTKVVYEQKRQSQFPTLGSLDDKNKDNQKYQKNYIQQIQDGYLQEKKKESFFMPSKIASNINHDFTVNYNSMYSIKGNPHAYEDIQILSKQYNGMSVDSLKFIYHQLHDLNTCKQFLLKYYPDKKYHIKVQEIKPIKVQAPKKMPEPIVRKKSIDADFKDISLKEIRDELDHLFKLKNLFKLTKSKTTNIAYRKQLERLANKDENRIRKLCEVSREKLIEEMAESHPQYVDLHGYRQEEVDDTLDAIRKMLISQFRRGNSKVTTQRVGANVYAKLKVLTGKGKHSYRYGKSILKPAVKEWAQYFEYQAAETEDSIDIFVQLN